MESLLLARPKYGIHKFNEPCLNWRFMGGRGGRTGDLLARWFALLFCKNCILGGTLLRCTADILMLCYLQFHLSIQDFWQTQLSITIPTEWGKKWLFTFYNTHCYLEAGPPYGQSIKKTWMTLWIKRQSNKIPAAIGCRPLAGCDFCCLDLESRHLVHSGNHPLETCLVGAKVVQVCSTIEVWKEVVHIWLRQF